MRLLIVNPNTSSGVTANIRAAAGDAALPGDDFTTVSAAFGPELIVTPSDAAHAARGVVETVSAHEAPCDGIILASFGDTGAREVRALRPDIPVIGIATAAFATARTLGGPFGIVTFGAGLVEGLRRKVAEAALEDDLLDITAVAAPDIGDPGEVQCTHFDEMHRLCAQMAERGARSIVFGGGPLAGLASKMAMQVPVPLIDGTQSAVSILRSVVRPREPAA